MMRYSTWYKKKETGGGYQEEKEVWLGHIMSSEETLKLAVEGKRQGANKWIYITDGKTDENINKRNQGPATRQKKKKKDGVEEEEKKEEEKEEAVEHHIHVIDTR